MDSQGKVVVIGSGAAGQGTARTLVAAGWHVTVVERGKVGGTCLWYGCMPKKALYNAARARRLGVRAELFGLDLADGFDWQSVLAWKWHAQETYAGDQVAIMADRGIELVHGDARFVSALEIAVEDQVFEFDHAVIATGSRPVILPVEGTGLGDTSDDALSYGHVPTSLLVVGAGFIGIEMATIYASFGSEVTVVTNAQRPLDTLDEDVALIAVRRLERMGVRFFSSCRMQRLSGSRGAIDVEFTDGENTERSGRWERVLVAAGRRPAIADLALEAAAITIDGQGGIVLDENQCTTNPRVWAAGDAAGGAMHTPVASYEGRTVAASIDSGVPVVIDSSLIPSCLYTSPQITQVGLTEAQARSSGMSVDVSRMPFEYLGAAVIEDERDGIVKLVFAEDDGRLVGAQVAGPTASDLIYALALAIRCGATRDTLRATVGIHPAYSEALNWAAG